jgi:hypothetical protein
VGQRTAKANQIRGLVRRARGQERCRRGLPLALPPTIPERRPHGR